MNKSELSLFRERLKEHSARIQELVSHCENEEQTKISIINPTIELLDYDVRDPRVVKLEYPINPRGGGERADYALFTEDSKTSDEPSLLIEAKSASRNLDNIYLTRQVATYADHRSGIRFVALTNGVTWKWFRKERNNYGDSRLAESPFLVHDMSKPGTQELDFLFSIRGSVFNEQAADVKAENIQLARVVMSWLREILKDPDDKILGLLNKVCVRPDSKRNKEQLKGVWLNCVNLLIEQEISERRVDDIVSLSKNKPDTDEDSSSPQQSNTEAQHVTREFQTATGPVSLSTSDFNRAWKPIDSEHWVIEDNARKVLFAVCNHFSQIHSGDNFFNLASVARPMLIITDEGYGQLNEQQRRRYAQVSNGFYALVHSSNSNKRRHISRLSELVQTDRKRNESGELVDLWLDNTT